MFTFYDIEYIFIYICLLLLFLFSLKRRGEKRFYSGGGISFVIDLNTSNALKGIACVMVLTAHWGQRHFDIDMPWGISKVVWNFSATMALVWFMFFSGYGLSLKKVNGGDVIPSLWIGRLKKVYLPLLFSCIICTICYVLLPLKFSLEESSALWVSKDIYYIHHLNWHNFNLLWPHILGWKDWYVFCIMMFYSFFFLSIALEKHTHLSMTVWLFVLLCIYYIWASWYFGRQEAHFFRYCWVFFAGHVTAKWRSCTNKKLLLLMSLLLSTTIIFESKIYVIGALFSVVVLVIISFVNRKYYVSGKSIMLLGGVSYFFYLLHTRICYTLIVYLDANSIIIWCFLTFALSYLVRLLYNKLINVVER